MLSYADVSQRLNLNNKGRAKCPAHGGKKLSLSVWGDDDGTLGLKCWSHGCDYTDIVHAISGLSTTGPASEAPSGNRKTDKAYIDQIWRESEPAPGSLVEVYLTSRSITVPTPSTVRYVPDLAHWPSQTNYPAMLCAISNSEVTHMTSLHRTYLRADGNGKADVTPNKMALGAISGGSFRTAPADLQLVITEGAEDALTLWQALGIPAWATLGASNLATVWLPPLPLAREVIVAVDTDTAGEKAALMARARFAKEGRRVRLMRPPPGSGHKDFNDMLGATKNG
jgi:putative DNA primase/helicase